MDNNEFGDEAVFSSYSDSSQSCQFNVEIATPERRPSFYSIPSQSSKSSLRESLSRKRSSKEKSTEIGGLGDDNNVVRPSVFSRIIRKAKQLTRGQYFSSDNFSFSHELGRGAEAIVWNAEPVTSTETISRLPYAVAMRCVDLSKKRRFERRAVEKSALIHRTVRQHSNIATIYGSFREASKHYEIIEKVQGTPLTNVVPDEDLKKREVFAIQSINQVLSALSFMHSQGISHGDLCPDNIMIAGYHERSVDCAPKVKLIDFGYSFSWDPKKPETEISTMRRGTPLFSAPEVFWDEYSAPKADLFSIGALVYYMINGKAFGDGAHDVLSFLRYNEVSFDDEIWKRIREDIRIFICNCMELDPSRRRNAELALSWSETILEDID